MFHNLYAQTAFVQSHPHCPFKSAPTHLITEKIQYRTDWQLCFVSADT